jgi:hypothetical protein
MALSCYRHLHICPHQHTNRPVQRQKKDVVTSATQQAHDKQKRTITTTKKLLDVSNSSAGRIMKPYANAMTNTMNL